MTDRCSLLRLCKFLLVMSHQGFSSKFEVNWTAFTESLLHIKSHTKFSLPATLTLSKTVLLVQLTLCYGLDMKCSPWEHILIKWTPPGDADFLSCSIFSRQSLERGSRLLNHDFRAIIYQTLHKLSPIPGWLRHSMLQQFVTTTGQATSTTMPLPLCHLPPWSTVPKLWAQLNPSSLELNQLDI